MEVKILSKNQFIDKVLPFVESEEGAFFISIMDGDEPEPLHTEMPNYKTWWFYDLEEDIANYKAITEEQAKQIYEYIKSHSNKTRLFVHCAAGISRSGAVGSFAFEYFGGRYKDLLLRHPHILPNGRITRLLRLYERIDYMGDDVKIQF